jgi:hypothetical protein
LKELPSRSAWAARPKYLKEPSSRSAWTAQTWLKVESFLVVLKVVSLVESFLVVLKVVSLVESFLVVLKVVSLVTRFIVVLKVVSLVTWFLVVLKVVLLVEFFSVVAKRGVVSPHWAPTPQSWTKWLPPASPREAARGSLVAVRRRPALGATLGFPAL